MIQSLAARATATDVLIVHAGTPASRAAPGGMADIFRRGSTGTLGTSRLTLIKSAAAFSAPRFATTNQVQRSGSRVEHYAVVQRTSSSDATHDSFYPAAGDHQRPGMTQVIDGRTYNHYWRVSQ